MNLTRVEPEKILTGLYARARARGGWTRTEAKKSAAVVAAAAVARVRRGPRGGAGVRKEDQIS